MIHVRDKQSHFILNSSIFHFKIRCWTEAVSSPFLGEWGRVWGARGEYTKGKSGASVGVATPPPPCFPTHAFASHAFCALFAHFPRAHLALTSARLKHEKKRRLFRSIQQRNEPYSNTIFTKLTLSAAIIIRVTFSLPDSLKMSASTRITALFL